LKQTIEDQNKDIRAALEREAVLHQQNAKVITEKNDSLRRERQLQDEKSQACEMSATESKKRKQCEKSTEKLQKNITVLQTREQELETAFQQSTAAEQKLRMENTRLRMQITAQQM